MKTLIVYYSRTGNTRAACEVLQKELGGDIIEVRDLKSREGGLGFFTAAVGSLFGTHTGIEPEKADFSEYGTVIIGSPVWAGKLSTAIRTFIARNRFDGKKVILLTTTNVFEKERSQNRAKKMVIASGGNVAGFFQIAVMGKVDGKKTERTRAQIVDDAAKIAGEIKTLCMHQ